MPLTGNSPLVVLIGPTAVGKTETALKLAQALSGEIISADSRQIYRYMDIGTAKPTSAQQAQAQHHLIDIIDPDQAYNVTDFQHDALAIINRLHHQGRLPLLVGGTGQYVSAVVQGWRFPGVEANMALRQELEAYAESNGWQALLERLRQVDPVTAAQIDGRNVRRVVRALEVCIESGEPFSNFQRKSPPSYTMKTFGLTLEREALYQRADQRVNAMLAAGFVDEVQALIAQGYALTLPAMSALGYLQIGYYLRDMMSLDEAIQELKRATRSFIRRQYTWFRKYNSEAIWVEADAHAAERILEMI